MYKTDVLNISEYVFGFAEKSPDKLLLLQPEKITYGEFCHVLDAYAIGFLKAGISRGTKTIVLIPPGIDLFATFFALLRIGSVPVLIDPGMGIKAMVKALSNANAQAFIGIPASLFLKYIFPIKFKSVSIWISSGRNFIPKGKKLSRFELQQNEKYEVAKMNREDDAAIFFTSGSTGPAKAVVYKHYMLIAQLNHLKEHFSYHPREIDFCTFPLIGLFSMCLGLSVVLANMDMTHPARLKPGNLLQAINRFDCTYMFCSPMVLKKLAEFGNRNKIQVPTLKKIMSAGAPVTPEVLKGFSNLIADEAEIHTPYGATEALPVTDVHHKELIEVYEHSNCYANGICVGYPLKNIDLRIIKISDAVIQKWEKAEECKIDEVGEIVVRGENVSQSYFENKTANKFSKIKDSNSSVLWHRMGDVGRIDNQGRVWFYGRKSQRVEAAGKTLFTIPTEAVFNQHKDVERSALLGLHKNGKTLPVVCIQLKKGRKRTSDKIRQLQALAAENESTAGISEFFFYKRFPVDPRHNAKIYREKLVQWTQKKIK